MKKGYHITDNIAHDLKTPLARLRNRLEEISVKIGEDSTHKADIDFALQQTDQLLSTLNSILRIANIESHSDRFVFSPVSLSEILADVVDLYEPTINDKQLSLGRDIQAGVTCNGDKNLLFQAFANLLDNAVKHTPKNGIIELALSSNTQYHSILLKDSGPGIPTAEFDSVFERFYQVDTSRNQPGNGLGLALVKAVTDLHGFKIKLDNQAPGLIVSIKVPLYD